MRDTSFRQAAGHGGRRTIAGLLGLLALTACTEPAELAAYTPDGCQVYPGDSAREDFVWLNCCVEHDLAYWLGGSAADRETTDTRLEACLAEAGDPVVVARMLARARAGRPPWWPVGLRWGYGWSWFRGYADITEQERALATLRLFDADFDRLLEDGIEPDPAP